jgi:hypothetical protein
LHTHKPLLPDPLNDLGIILEGELVLTNNAFLRIVEEVLNGGYAEDSPTFLQFF